MGTQLDLIAPTPVARPCIGCGRETPTWNDPPVEPCFECSPECVTCDDCFEGKPRECVTCAPEIARRETALVGKR